MLLNRLILKQPLKHLKDRNGNPRVTGEEWLVRKVGAYLPSAYEEVIAVEDAFVLTEKVRISHDFPLQMSCFE